jgi:ABC-2 type transport system ATP-binding protein
MNAVAPVLLCSELRKSYGKSAVLDGISFELPAGAFTGLVGVNGAGKTTLIKCLLDFCDFQSGRIELFGMSHAQPEARRRLSYLPERFVPPFFLTGREFLAIMPGFAGDSFAVDAVAAMLADLELDEAALDRPVRSYSKGMMQKLGLAACLLAARALVVLDEPMSGLDPLARIRVKRRLAALRGDGGTTLLLTSHSLADIGEICDHMLVLHAGRLLYQGTPENFRREHGAVTLEEAFLSRVSGAVKR